MNEDYEAFQTLWTRAMEAQAQGRELMQVRPEELLQVRLYLQQLGEEIARLESIARAPGATR